MWPRSRYNNSGPDPLGFDWEDLAASRGTVSGHRVLSPLNSLGIDSRNARNEILHHPIDLCPPDYMRFTSIIILPVEKFVIWSYLLNWRLQFCYRSMMQIKPMPAAWCSPLWKNPTPIISTSTPMATYFLQRIFQTWASMNLFSKSMCLMTGDKATLTKQLSRSGTGPRFNIKMLSYWYRKSHCGDETVVRSSYLHNGISYTGMTTSFYHTPTSTKLKGGYTGITLSVCPSIRLSVCGQNRVRSVSSTILIGSISYLHILSSNLCCV